MAATGQLLHQAVSMQMYILVCNKDEDCSVYTIIIQVVKSRVTHLDEELSPKLCTYTVTTWYYAVLVADTYM
jgi:hypothetical protein